MSIICRSPGSGHGREAVYSSEGCGDDNAQSIPNNTFGWGRIDALFGLRGGLLALPTPPAPDRTSLPVRPADMFIPTWFGP